MPKVEFIARGVLVEEGRVLLCRNVEHGYLYLPGGHIEFGESAAVALARELMEEGEVEIRVGEPAMASEEVFEAGGKRHHELNLVFHVERVGDGEVRSVEADIALEWYELAAVADLDVRPASAKAFLVSGGDVGGGGFSWVSAVG